jgi:hypothetical protein
VLKSNDKVEAERTIPAMRAALLSANKYYGTPLPPDHNDPIIYLELCRRLIEKMLPFMGQGHVQEAREEAASFLARFETGSAGSEP